MTDITKRKFTELALDGNNYLTWALDVEIHLTSSDLSGTIVQGSQSTAAQKAKALIFLRHHLNQDLKNEYFTEKDPTVLWKSLKDRFHQQTHIILPQAQYDWLNPRFEDFKSVTEYNSALHRIVSQLKLCQQKITEAELLQKTLSTFHASNLVLQQQYRAKNYTSHSELISALLVAGKHNQLLMKNHNARPVGSLAVPEAVPETHATSHENDNGHRRGRGRRWGRGRGWGRGQGSGRRKYDDAQIQGRGKGVNHTKNPQPTSGPYIKHEQICYKCGYNGHWSRTCHTPKHLVEVYQRMQKDKKGKAPQGESHHTSLPEVNFDMENVDLLKVELKDFGDNE